MALRDRNISTAAKVGWKPILVPLGTTATGQTAKAVYVTTPGFPFTVCAVDTYALTVTATATIDVQIGTTSVLSAQVTPVNTTETAGTLSTTYSNTQGGSADALSVLYTTGASGAVTGGLVTVWIKPTGMDGDPIEKG